MLFLKMAAKLYFCIYSQLYLSRIPSGLNLVSALERCPPQKEFYHSKQSMSGQDQLSALERCPPKARFPLGDFFRAKGLSIVKIEQISDQFQSRAHKTKAKVASREKSCLVANGLQKGVRFGRVDCTVKALFFERFLKKK